MVERHWRRGRARELAEAERYGGHGALLVLDLDGFTYINDFLGYQAGDELLKSLAVVLRRRLCTTDVVARLGGQQPIMQPILDLRSQQISQYEALLCMVGDDGELVPPVAFLDVAERAGLLHAIDCWIVRRAIHMIAEQQRKGRGLSLGVNLSGGACSDPELLPLIQRELIANAVNPGRLVGEQTIAELVGDATTSASPREVTLARLNRAALRPWRRTSSLTEESFL